jgi:hypothetical protein
MEITIQKVNQSLITLEFLQDLEEGIDDVTPLVNSLVKLKSIINKPGFGNKFNKKEKELWNDIFTQVLDLPSVGGIQSAGINMVHIQKE